MLDLNKIMLDYLKQYPPTNELLKFNCSTSETGEISLNTISGETVLEQYTNGDKVKTFTFAIAMMKDFDNGYSDINIDEMFDAKQFIEWIKQQNRLGNLPNIPNCYLIEPLQDMPDLAGTDGRNVAKYMFSCRVEFIETKMEG